MSVVDSLKNLFAKKRPDGEETTSAELSLGMPDASMDPNATGTIEAGSTQGIEPSRADPDSVDDSMTPGDEVDEAELVAVPLLGRRSIVTHQRILFTLLALALVVLGSVAIFAVNQADKVAQQVAGTGSSLMQS